MEANTESTVMKAADGESSYMRAAVEEETLRQHGHYEQRVQVEKQSRAQLQEL